MKMPKNIETDRLLLVPMSRKYAEDVFREFTPELTYYMSPPTPSKIDDSIDWIESTLPKYEAGTDFTFAIILKENGEFIGGGGIHNIDTMSPEFGIWTKKSSHGNRYGREAIRGANSWVDENLKCDYVKYPVFADNIASRKIPESLGGVIFREYTEKNNVGVELPIVEYRIYKK
ncbi:MAG: GNAT family N-acetyltransferase [bacterium]